jgi:hypothetical protein
MINLFITLADGVTGLLRDEQVEAINAGGGLDPEQVYFKYHTMHDDRVRPSHAALDGTVWKVGDPFAPVPPIAYGCRCSMSYVSKSGTPAAEILPVAEKEIQTKGAVFATALDRSIPAWKDLAASARAKPPALRFAFLQSTLRTKFDAATAKDYAQMILEASATLQQSNG